MLRRIDGWLVGRAEAWSHWWQLRTGVTNFWWAKKTFAANAFYMIFLHLAALSAAVPKAVEYQMTVVTFGLTAFNLAMVWRMYRVINAMEAHYAKGTRSGHFHTMVFNDFWWARVSAMLFMVISGLVVFWHSGRIGWIETAFYLCWIGLPVSIYLMSVKPLPPEAQRQYQRDKAFAANLRPLPVTNPIDGR